MNDIIKISVAKINGAEINSVNARDLHTALEIKRDFNAWMSDTREILETYEEGVDYIRTTLDRNNSVVVVKKSLNLKGKQAEYVMSLDMCKHISMMSKSEKGRGVRKYFIEVEKQSQKVLSTSEQIALIAQGHQQTEQRLVTLEHKVDNDIPLTSAQKHNIKQKVNVLVYQLKKDHNLHDDFIPKCYSRVWKKVKNHFIVSSYMEIPKSKFDELVRVVGSITIADVV